jgi:hypothetical protein
MVLPINCPEITSGMGRGKNRKSIIATKKLN